MGVPTLSGWDVLTYTFDGEGRPLTATSAAGTATYTWNADGQLVSETDSTNTTTTYTYGDDGELLSATTPVLEIEWVYQDGWALQQNATVGESSYPLATDVTWDTSAGCITSYLLFGGDAWEVIADAAGRISELRGPSSPWLYDYGPAPGCTVNTPITTAPGGAFVASGAIDGTPGLACLP